MKNILVYSVMMVCAALAVTGCNEGSGGSKNSNAVTYNNVSGGSGAQSDPYIVTAPFRDSRDTPSPGVLAYYQISVEAGASYKVTLSDMNSYIVINVGSCSAYAAATYTCEFTASQTPLELTLYADSTVSPYTLQLEKSSTGSNGSGNSSSIEPLNFFESDMAHKWSRYHAYDGSTQYYIFNGDRTACYFEISSSNARTKYIAYEKWSLLEVAGQSNVFDIVFSASDGTIKRDIDEFHYVPNEIWYGGYSNLALTTSTTSYTCD